MPSTKWWPFCLSFSVLTGCLTVIHNLQKPDSLKPMQTGFNYKNVISVSFVNGITCSLTHWGLVKHICVSKLIIIGSDNGLWPSQRQAIIWTNARILSIRPLGTKLIETLIEIYTFLFKKMPFKMSSAKWRPFCLGLNVLIQTSHDSDLAGSTDNKIQSILINRWHVFSRKINLITKLTHVLSLKTPGLDLFIFIEDLDWLSITFELFHDNITMASHEHHVSQIIVNLAVCETIWNIKEISNHRITGSVREIHR